MHRECVSHIWPCLRLAAFWAVLSRARCMWHSHVLATDAVEDAIVVAQSADANNSIGGCLGVGRRNNICFARTWERLIV